MQTQTRSFARARTCTLALIALALVACSSDAATSADAGTSARDGATDGATSTLPSCVTEGLQCQPKGCNPGYEPLGAYDCGSAGGSCCGKSVAKLDAGADATNPTDATSVADAAGD